MDNHIQSVKRQLADAEACKAELEEVRTAEIHPTDDLRNDLRKLSSSIQELEDALLDSRESVSEQTALRAELISAKRKAERADKAGTIQEGVKYERCPECGTDVSRRQLYDDRCRLCGSHPGD